MTDTAFSDTGHWTVTLAAKTAYIHVIAGRYHFTDDARGYRDDLGPGYATLGAAIADCRLAGFTHFEMRG